MPSLRSSIAIRPNRPRACSPRCAPRRGRAALRMPRDYRREKPLRCVRGKSGAVVVSRRTPASVVVARRKPAKSDAPIPAADVIEFIETVCLIPEGKLVGKPFVLQQFQKKIIELIYDNPRGTRRAIISVARKNAKTCLAAC